MASARTVQHEAECLVVVVLRVVVAVVEVADDVEEMVDGQEQTATSVTATA